jgi:hypothetical protein
MTNSEAIERLRQVVAVYPEFRPLLESKHIGSMLKTRWHDDLFNRKLHQAVKRPERSDRAKLIGASTLGLMALLKNKFVRQIFDTLKGIEHIKRTLRDAGFRLVDDEDELDAVRASGAKKIDALHQELEGILRDTYKQAYATGIKSHGFTRYGSPAHLSDEEQRWVNSAVRDELKYLRGLMRDVEEGTPVQSLIHRVRMYGDTLNSVYKTGQVVALPIYTVIHWDVDPIAKHCQDCLTLQRYGPYTKSSLPTTPGAGHTACRSNCRCELRYEKVSPADFRKTEREGRTKAYLMRMVAQRANARKKK